MRKQWILGPFLRFSIGPRYEAKDIGIKSVYVKDRNGFFQIKTLKKYKEHIDKAGAYELQQREGVAVESYFKYVTRVKELWGYDDVHLLAS